MEIEFDWGSIATNPLLAHNIKLIVPYAGEFVVEHLEKRILPNCVECKVHPRERTDKQTAEYLKGLMEESFPDFLPSLSKRFHNLKAFDVQRQEQHFYLPAISGEIINSTWDEGYSLALIRAYLEYLPMDRLIYLSYRAVEEAAWDKNFWERYCGKLVWDFVFRPTIEKRRISPYRGNEYPSDFKLHPDLYGEVWHGRSG